MRVRQLLDDRRMSIENPAIPWPYELSMATEWIDSQLPRSLEGTHLFYAVCLDEELVGAVDLRLHQEARRGWLGYWTGIAFWRQGIATEAASAVIEHGFTALGLTRIDAIHVSGNEGSSGVMRKLGMRHISTTEAAELKGWEFGDIEQYSLNVEDYQRKTDVTR